MEREHDAPRWRRYLRFWGADPDADVEAERRFGDVTRVRA